MQLNSKLRPVTPTSIIATELEELTESIASFGWTPESKHKLGRLSQIAGGLDSYVEFCTTPQSQELKSLQDATNSSDWTALNSEGDTVHELESEMLSGHVEGQFLKFLITISGAKRILEIGMFTGYATLAMAEALPQDGRVIACELDPYTAEFAQSIFKRTAQSAKIDVRVGSAHEELQQLADQSQQFDLIFIDAEKSGYVDYLEAILSRNLLASNGFVVVDNTLMQGQPYCGLPTPNGDAIREFNEFVRQDSRVEQVLVPLRDGLTLIRVVGDEAGVGHE